MEIVSRDEVLEIVKKKGPLLPREVVKDLGKSDTFMIGAVLSELISASLVKVTNTKIGASPTYYCPGQEDNLVNLSKYLNEKDRRAYDLIESKKIVRDSKQEPLMRVSLRAIKDFAKPLEINVNGKKEVFWKWYLLTNDEAVKHIRGLFAPKVEAKPEQELKVEPEIVPEPVQIKKEEEEPVEVKPVVEPQPVKEEVIVAKATVKPQTQSKLVSEESEDLEETEFLTQIRQYFTTNDIIIESEQQIKKNSEYDFLIKIPSAFGRINFFCKAKSKKKNNEADVASAYLASDEYRLPTIFLTTGEFTKKAEKELEKFKQITIKSI